MFCQKCGSQIPDDSTFCRNCGAPIGKKAAKSSPLITNLLNTVKSYFSKNPENGIMNAAGSKSIEWAILLGVNILFFMFAFAITSACLKFGFGFPLLFGLIIALIFNVVMFGALFGALALMHKKLPFAGMLNLYAYTTIPVTAAALISMPLAPAWHLLPMIFMGLGVLFQVILMFVALQKAANDGRVNFHLFAIVMIVALAIVFVAAHWLNVASVRATIRGTYASLVKITEDLKDDNDPSRKDLDKFERAYERYEKVGKGFDSLTKKYVKDNTLEDYLDDRDYSDSDISSIRSAIGRLYMKVESDK